MSLLWHPDRWVSYPALYVPAVQGIFELISNAYNALSVSHTDHEVDSSEDGVDPFEDSSIRRKSRSSDEHRFA